MDRANEVVVQVRKTPKTDVAKFTITAKDVGSPAVRAGHMAELEEEHRALLIAVRIALQRGKSGHSKLDSITEHCLTAALRVAEAGF